jgi:hypothetical protein
MWCRRSLWTSGQSSWLQIQRSGLLSRRYHMPLSHKLMVSRPQNAAICPKLLDGWWSKPQFDALSTEAIEDASITTSQRHRCFLKVASNYFTLQNPSFRSSALFPYSCISVYWMQFECWMSKSTDMCWRNAIHSLGYRLNRFVEVCEWILIASVV